MKVFAIFAITILAIVANAAIIGLLFFLLWNHFMVPYCGFKEISYLVATCVAFGFNILFVPLRRRK